MSASAINMIHDNEGVILRPAIVSDSDAINQLMAVCFGEGRFARTVRHLRLCAPVEALSFVLEKDGELVGSIRYWPIAVGGKTQLLLGPLAVHPHHKGCGFGKALVAHSLAEAERLSYDFILISGEPDYYPRFGFEPVAKGQFIWPGFVEPERLQVKWLGDGKQQIIGTGAHAILPILACQSHLANPILQIIA